MSTRRAPPANDRRIVVTSAPASQPRLGQVLAAGATREPPREPEPKPGFKKLATRAPNPVSQPATVAELFDRLLAMHAVDTTEMKRAAPSEPAMTTAPANRKINEAGNPNYAALWEATSKLCKEWTYNVYGDGAIGCRNIFAALYFTAKVLTEGAIHPAPDALMSFFPRDESWFTYKGRFLGFYLKEKMDGEKNRLSERGRQALSDLGDVKFTLLKESEKGGWAEVINADCKKATHNKIPTIIGEDSLQNPRLECVLLCAEYMKVKWENLFKLEDTEKEAPFYGVINGAMEEGGTCRMMKNDHKSYRLFNGVHCHAVFLRTKPQEGLGGDIQVMAVLPKQREATNLQGDDSPIVKAEQEIADRAAEVLAAGQGAFDDVIVEIPRMEIKMEPKSVLKLCTKVFPESLFYSVPGLTESEDKNEPDNWRSINGVGISKIEHATFIRMDELGAEAAAATVVSMFRSLCAEEVKEYITLRFDRPYIVYIVDTGGTVPAVLYKVTIMDSRMLFDVSEPDEKEYWDARAEEDAGGGAEAAFPF